VVVVLVVVGFAGAVGFLARTLQRRPTWVELAGFPWAFGFFLAKGYLSYLIGLALAFVLVGLLHRTAGRADGPSPARHALLGVLGVALYLSHLLAWAIGMLAVALYATVLHRRGRSADARLLGATQLPAVVLLAWYAVAEHGGSGLSLYTSWTNKAISLAEPPLFFVRLDPFPPPFPVFWANVAVAGGVAVLVATQTRWARVRWARVRVHPVLVLAAVCAAVAVLLPVAELNELIKPDERFVLPAVLFVLTALPQRRVRPAAGAAAAALVAAVLGLHAVEYAAAAREIGQLDAAVDATVPPGARVLELAIPSRTGCTPASGVAIGVPTLKWFGVDHVLETGGAVVALDETSIVHARPDAGPPDLVALTPTDAADAARTALAAAPPVPDLLLVACPDDLDASTAALGAAYTTAARGPGYAILTRRRAG
jgi:hypothetical protein